MKRPAPPPAPVTPAPDPAEEKLGERFLTLKQVREKIGTATSTIYRWMEAKQFPEPKQVTDTMVRWRMSDIDAWMEGKPTSERIGSLRGQRKKNRVSGRV